MKLQQLGPFELIRVLGRGGMGTVYEAREPDTPGLVAVKALAPQFSFDERFRLRFEGEIDALMKLEHENIVRLLSYGQDEGNLYFAMELVDGCSLFQEQKKGQVFHWREIIAIAKQVCAGLRHAHERGIIHRDLKPGNLMIAGNRHVKITDFGIAKSYGSSSMTSEGNVLGTMDFMSPEQARGLSVTARSDLFSLGAVLYSLLAGRPPFLHETVERTFESLLSPNPPVRLNKIAKDIPAPLAMLIHRMLEKDPAKRLATAMAVGRQLQHVEEAVLGSLDSDTQVVNTEPSESEVEPGETFTPGQIKQGAATGAPADSLSPDVTRFSAGESNDDEDAVARQPNYFNEVTPQQRQKTTEPAASEEVKSRAWPLVLALVAVIGVLAFGVWYTVIRKPGPDTLLAVIDESADYPIRIQNELAIFSRFYPDHEQADNVNELRVYVDAIKFRNLLNARQRRPRARLSEAELQFLEITEMKPTQAPQALERMQAYLAFHSDDDHLSAADRKVVECARVYLPRIQLEADKQILRGLENITTAMDRASRSSNTADKLAIYNFIIEMYAEDKWAEKYVDQSRNAIQRIGKQQTEDEP